MYGDVITIGEAVTVCLFSIVTVFLVLLLISYIVDLTAWVIRKIEKKPEPAAPKAAPAPAAAPAAAAPAKKDTSADAVIVAAAVAAYLGTSTDRIIVRSIRRVAEAESSWSQASRFSSAH